MRMNQNEDPLKFEVLLLRSLRTVDLVGLRCASARRPRVYYQIQLPYLASYQLPYLMQLRSSYLLSVQIEMLSCTYLSHLRYK